MMTDFYSVRLRALVMALLALFLCAGSLSAQWSELTDLPSQRTSAMSAVLGEKLYVFGGANAAGTIAQEAWVLDLTNPDAGWSSIAGMPQNRSGGYAVAYNGKIYILAGLGQEGTAGVLRTNVLEYDPALDAYSTKAAMPSGTFYSAGALAGTKVYLISGRTVVGGSAVQTPAVQIYDLVADSWSTGTPVPNSGYYFGQAVAVGTDIYWFGGRDASTMYTGALKLTGGTGSWSTVQAPLTPVFGGAITNINGKIYLAGGSNGSAAIATSQFYDPSTNSWTSYFPAATAIFTPAYTSDGTSLYVVTGATGTATYKMDVVAPKPVANIVPTSIIMGVEAGAAGSKAIYVQNLGTMPLNGTISIPGDAPWLTTTSPTFTVAAGTYTTVSFRANAGSLSPGAYSTTATITTNDVDHASVPISIKVYVAADLVRQDTRILLEEVTGAWCNPCGAYGTPLVRQLGETYGERLVTIAYHVRSGGTGDPMATNSTEGINSWLGASGYVPSASIHRIRYDAQRTGYMSEKRDLWPSAIDNVFQALPYAPIAMDIEEYSYDPTAKRVTAKIKLTTADAISLANDGKVMITAVVKEDSIQYPQNGSTEDPYYHMHVARSFYPTTYHGTQVDIPAEATAESGTILLPGKEITTTLSWSVTGVTVPTAADIAFILHLNYGDRSGQVLQAEDVYLTERRGGSGTVEATPDAEPAKTVDANATASFTTVLRNLTDAPIEVTFERTTQTLPESWTSQLCIGNDCSAPTTSSVTASVAPNSTLNLVTKINALSPSQTGSVTIRVTAGDSTFTYTYTATSLALGINDEEAVTAGLTLTAFPNPTSGTTTIEFSSARGGIATCGVYSATGTELLSFPSERYEGGKHSKVLDLASLPNGIYTVVLDMNGVKVSRTVTVVR